MQFDLFADTEALCRVCMTDKEGYRTDVYDASSLMAGQPSLHEMLKMICTSVFVKSDAEYLPGMPTKVCASCRNAILAAFKLHQTCIETDRRLGELLALKWELQGEEESGDPLKSGNIRYETSSKCVKLDGGSHLGQVDAIQNQIQSKSQEKLAELNTGKQNEESHSAIGNDGMIKVEELDFMDDSGNEGDYESVEVLAKDDDTTQRICEICSEKFDESARLKNHMMDRHQLYMCGICHATFGSQLWFSKHETLHAKAKDRLEVYPNRVDCSECGQTLTDTASLRAHLRAKCAQLKYLSLTKREIAARTCQICSKFFKNVRLLFKHVKMEHPGHNKLDLVVLKQRNKCSICHESFLTKAALTKHRQVHKPPSKCSICHKVFLTKDGLKSHMVRHTNKSFLCSLCPMRFYTKTELESHCISHKKQQTDRKFRKCTKCDETFPTKEALIKHRKVHQESGNCPICGKTLISKAALKVHMTRHSDTKQHPCDRCPLRFYTKGELNNHIISHANNRNNICDICGSKFTKQNSLKRHVKIVHEGIRPFECQICGFKFFSSSHLKRHLLGHTKEKLYQCELCPSDFAKTDELAHHVARKHRGGQPYPCDRCNESFRLLTELRQHYRVHFQAGEQIEDIRFTTMDILQRVFAKDKRKLAEGGNESN